VRVGLCDDACGMTRVWGEGVLLHPYVWGRQGTDWSDVRVFTCRWLGGLHTQVSGVETAWPVSGHQLSAAMYYLLDKGRVHRGNHPDAEQARGPDVIRSMCFACFVRSCVFASSFLSRTTSHASYPKTPTTPPAPPSNIPLTKPTQEEHRVCAPVSDPLLQELLGLAPLALHFIYLPSAVELQRRAAQQGWSLLFSQLSEQPGQPAFALLAKAKDKSACLVVRGPASVQDVVDDVHSLPMPFPHGTQHEKGGWTQVRGRLLCPHLYSLKILLPMQIRRVEPPACPSDHTTTQPTLNSCPSSPLPNQSPR
jgi:hypothetical protein